MKINESATLKDENISPKMRDLRCFLGGFVLKPTSSPLKFLTITSAGENASVAGALVNDLLMGPRDGKIKPSKFEEFCWESAWMEHKMLDVATIHLINPII